MTTNKEAPSELMVILLNETVDMQLDTIKNLQFHNRGLQTELRQVNEYKDKLTAAVHVLLDTIKRGDDPTAAMYQLEELL